MRINKTTVIFLPLLTSLSAAFQLRRQAQRTSTPLTSSVLSHHQQESPLELTSELHVVGGFPVRVNEYPYFVATSKRSCGGTLIDSDMILTAAHCQGPFLRDEYVAVGALYWDGSSFPRAQIRHVVRQYLHPLWDPTTVQNDVMVFQLDEPVDTTPIIINDRPELPYDHDAVTVVGFGVYDLTQNTTLSSVLRETELSVIPYTWCNDYYFDFIDNDSMICAGVEDRSRDADSGDSGGPLLDSETGVQVGIVSFGAVDVDHPGLGDYATVYTRTSTYAAWIHDRVCAMSATPPSDCRVKPPQSENVTFISVQVTITYDQYPNENFWRVDNSTGTTVAAQSSIPDASTTVTDEMALVPGRYVFVLTDSYADGICCGFGKGSVRISAVRPGEPVELLAISNGEFEEFNLELPFQVTVNATYPFGQASTSSNKISTMGWSILGAGMLVLITAVAIISVHCCCKPKR